MLLVLIKLKDNIVNDSWAMESIDLTVLFVQWDFYRWSNNFSEYATITTIFLRRWIYAVIATCSVSYNLVFQCNDR